MKTDPIPGPPSPPWQEIRENIWWLDEGGAEKKIYGSRDRGEKGELDYAISSCHCWLPGVYASLEAALMAFEFSDEILSRLQHEANIRAGGSGGIITEEDLRKAGDPS